MRGIDKLGVDFNVCRRGCIYVAEIVIVGGTEDVKLD